MPSLIRLVVVLLVLAGIGYGGMIALTMAVDPGEREMSYRIPSRDLWAQEGAAPALIPTP